MIYLGDIKLNELARSLMVSVISANQIGQSDNINQFEQKMAEFLGVKHFIAVANGTLADAVALAILKYQYPERDEVIMPALTFVAQANAVYYNHLKPIFVDIDDDLNINPELIKPTDKTLCIFPTHLLGRPAKMNRILSFGLPVVEDTCEALGSKLNGKFCGTFGDMGTVSFFVSHTITTGEGGGIATNNDEYAELARKLINHGKTDPKLFHFDMIGFNGKMNSMEAVIGLAMMPTLQWAIDTRHSNFKCLEQFTSWKEGEGEYICPHALPIIYDDSDVRDGAMKRLRLEHIESRNLFSSLPTQEKAYAYLGYKLGDFPKAEFIGTHGLLVPCHQWLTDKEIEIMAHVLPQLPGLQHRPPPKVEQMGAGGREYTRKYYDLVRPYIVGDVLDIGAGIGTMASEYSQKEEVKSVIAIDNYERLNEKKLDIPKVRYLNVDATKWEFSSKEQYDTIIMCEFIEHITK